MRDHLEESIQRSNILYEAATDPHAGRARELRALAKMKLARVRGLLDAGDVEGAAGLEHDAARDFRGADRILNCGTSKRAQLMSERYRARYCGRRDCPGCALRSASVGVMRIGLAVDRMKAQLVTMFTVDVKWRPGQDMRSVANMIRDFRRNLRSLRQRRWFRDAVAGGAGAIEPKVNKERRGFNLHAHVVLDANANDLGDVAPAWNELTGGYFSIDPKRPLLDDNWAFAGYITKLDTWAPEVATMDLRWLEAIRTAIRRQQLVLAWGSAKKLGIAAGTSFSRR